VINAMSEADRKGMQVFIPELRAHKAVNKQSAAVMA
jgi:hypothetical protein